MESYFRFSELTEFEQKMYYNYVYLYLAQACMQYPGFSEWYAGMFSDELQLKKGREIIICEKDDEIVGTVVLKSAAGENKICSLYVTECFRNNGIGRRLMELGMEWLDDKKPLMTIEEKKVGEFLPLLERFGFILKEKIRDYYSVGETEYVYNGVLEKEDD